MPRPRTSSLRPWARQPPPSGIFPSFLTSRYQAAGLVVLVACGAGAHCPDHLSGQRVAGRQGRHVVAAQDPAHRPGRDLGGLSNLLGSPAQASAGLKDALLNLGRGATWAGVGAARAVVQPRPAVGTVAVDPAMSALPGHAQFLGDVRDRTPAEDDATHQQASAVKG